MHPRPSYLIALLVGLAACHADRRPEATPAAPRAPTATAAAPTAATLRGHATYRERVKMPPGASLRVELLDAASGAVVARTIVRDVGGPPTAFSLDRPPSATAPALRAELVGPDGEPWFETVAPVAVPSGETDVELPLRRSSATATTPARPTAAIAHWECGELGVMSRFDNAARRVTLSYNGFSRVIPLARSASGARYADAAGDTFWTKGSTGTLRLAPDAPRDCVQAAQASPWNAALLRGVAFRAVGSEPGWSAEVSGAPPTLDAMLDYGERHVTAPLRAVPDGYEGRGDGDPIRLRITHATCHDGMSGQAFEATVVLEVARKAYRGCGADLRD